MTAPLPHAGAATPDAIRVMVVEDDPAFARQFCDAVSSAPALTLAGAAGSVREACAMVDRLSPDVVLVDLGLPDGRGIDVIRYAKAGQPARDVIVITMFEDPGSVIDSIRAGATGYLLKDTQPRDIAGAIVQVRGGGSPISPAIARQLLQTFQVRGSPGGPQPGAAEHGSTLSGRESEILRLVAKGFSFKEVGSHLAISSHTVITHVKRIYHKLEVHSRGEAVYEANQMGLL